MTATVFATLVGAVVTALRATPAVTTHVHRARMRALPQQWSTAVVVRPQSAEVEQGVGQSVANIWATQLQVECYARAPAAQAGDAAVDALLSAVVERLLADRSLGGIVGDLGLLGITYDFDVDAESTACATVTFSVRHASGAASINN